MINFNTTHFHITTEVRVYTSIDSAEHFARVRANWSDSSKVTRAFTWVHGTGWVNCPEAFEW